MKTPSKIIAASTAALIAAGSMATPLYAAEPVNNAEIINEQYLDANATITENAMKVQNFTTLVKALQASGMADDLMGDGPFTLFAPTNDAFAKLPEEAVADLMKPENRDMLRDVLSAHVVKGEFTPERIDSFLSEKDDEPLTLPEGVTVDQDSNIVRLTTISGDPIYIKKGAGEQLILRDAQSNLITTMAKDIQQANGVTYVIDGVMMPVS